VRKRTLAVLAATIAALAAPGCLRAYVFARLPQPVMPPLEAPAGVGSLSAEACGACHVDTYAEWKGSQMARSWTDPVFQLDFAHQGAVYACRYCHAPIPQQQPEIVTGLSSLRPVRGVGEANPAYDEALRDEGVTCAACHVREGAVEGTFEGHEAPHPVTVRADFGSAGDCAACHQSPAPPFAPLDRPLLDVVAEWEAWKANTGRSEDCVDCHMPVVDRALTAWTPAREAHRHDFPGAWSDEMVGQAIRVDEVTRTEAGVRVTVTNLAGHRFPSSDPARAVTIRARLATRDGHDASSEITLDRRVEFPSFTERWDTTLAPGETRALDLPFPAGSLGLSTGAEVGVYWSRLHNAIPAVRALESTPTLVHSTVAAW